MKLEGSCHCGAVRFRCWSRAPLPFSHCYCSICRKSGGSGSAVNLHAEANSLEVEGEGQIATYHAFLDHPHRTRRSRAERRFCRQCGSPLWLWDPRWPDLIHPFATVIDTPLANPPERWHIMLDYRAGWVPVPAASTDHHFPEFPSETLLDWHQRHGLVSDPDSGLDSDPDHLSRQRQRR